MFTGIISDIGTILHARHAESARIAVACAYPLESIVLGESIAVNGCCLTVVGKTGGALAFDLSAETLSCTAPRWQEGARVNLERALALGERLSGHFVTGHVDGLARLVSIAPLANAQVLTLEAPKTLTRFLAEKGSVTLEGVALTVNRVNGTAFEVCIIPHSWAATTLSERAPGDALNMEIDMIARYLDRLMYNGRAKRGAGRLAAAARAAFGHSL